MTIPQFAHSSDDEYSNYGFQREKKANPTKIAPRFSIIICTYNHRNLLLSTLASLRRQTLPSEQFEVIVIDNGSTDDTLNAVRTYINSSVQQNRQTDRNCRIHCLVEEQKSLAQARNSGFQAASGEIAVFLSDDTLVDPYFLEYLLLAYKETEADAIGGRVELRWETPRPPWLSNDMLEMLGYFSPIKGRTVLPTGIHFSTYNFSVKISVLRQLGGFTTYLGQYPSIETADFYQLLRQKGYFVYYEPKVAVTHRVPASSLKQTFFINQAYQRGCTEMVMQYIDSPQKKPTTSFTLKFVFSALLQEVSEFLQLTLLHRPILLLTGKSFHERLLAAMAQAQRWGHISQRLRIIEHAPAKLARPSVLLICSDEQDAALVTQGLAAHHIRCTTRDNRIPLTWLWQHRAYGKHSIGLVHCYRPGALSLNYWQRQQFYWHLWLAQKLGIRIFSTDTGGYWQHIRNLQFLTQRTFEQKVFMYSDILFAYTRQPEEIYPNKILRRRVRCLNHPGLYGLYPEPFPQKEACKQLGLDQDASFIYLCFASQHSEHEILYLIDAFSEAVVQTATIQLLIVGSPRDKREPQQILQRAAYNAAIHLYGEEHREDIPLLLGAAQAIAIPHFASPLAGILAEAMLFISHERIVIAPELPHFHGMLPPQACVFYDPGNLTSLVQALIAAQTRCCCLSEKEMGSLDAERGWRHYAQRVLNAYKHLLHTSQ